MEGPFRSVGVVGHRPPRLREADLAVLRERLRASELRTTPPAPIPWIASAGT
jgi:hypothetical protein